MASSAKPARIALFALFLSAALLFGIASSAKCDLVAGQECSLTDLSACCSAGLVCDGTAKLCCVPSGSEIRCIKDGDCCSGQCNGLCVSGWACGHACSLSSQCGEDCPMCMDNGQGVNVCSSCIANGSLTSCSSDSQCCAGLHCASSTSRCVDCLEEGNTCNTHSDCCSNSCELRQDGSRKCAVFQAPQSCRLQGQYCSASISCCSGIPSPAPLSCDYQNPLPPGGIAGDGACRNCIPETFSCSAGGLSCCKSRDTCRTTVASGGATFCLAPNGATNTTHIFRNWVQVGNASFNLTSLKRSGASAVLMDASASNADSYIYNSKLALKNGSNYLLEFFANGSVRYAIYDAGNDAYLGSGGEWVFSPRNATGYEQPVISDSGFAAGNYSYGRRMFTTLASNVNHVQIRFYPKSGGGRLSLDDVSITELNDFSQFAWVRPETGSNGTIFSQMGAENGSAQGFSWRISGGKTLTLNYSSALGIAGAPASAAAAIELPQDGGWHHVGISVLRRGNYTIYLDGSRYSSGSFANMGRLNNSANFTIGKPQGGVSFNGTLDEVRFYQRALLPQEIADLYSGSKSGKCEITAGFSYGTPGIVASDLSSAYNAQLRIRALPSTTVLSMPFDVNVSSTSMGAIADYSRYGMHGTKLSGAAWSPDGKYGGAYYMSGGANGSIYLCSGCLSNLQYYTATAWVKPDYSGSDTYYAILAADTSSGLNVLLRRSDGRLGAICDSGLAFAPLAVPNNAWTFVAVRGFRNQTGGFIEASVNGGNWTQVCTGTANSFLYDNTAFYIGSKGQATYRAKGTIDEVRVFNTAISPSELQSLYAEGATVYSNRVPAPSIAAPLPVPNASSNITPPGLLCGSATCGQSQYCCNLTSPYYCYDNITTFCNASVACTPTSCQAGEYCCAGVGCMPNSDVSCGCRELNESGSYVLSRDVFANDTITGSRACYEVTAKNVALDCQGHQIARLFGKLPEGRALNSGAEKTVLKNCDISGFDGGAFFYGAKDSTLENVKIISANYPAVSIEAGSNGTISGLNASSKAYATVFISDSPNQAIAGSHISSGSQYGIALNVRRGQNASISSTTVSSENGTGIELSSSNWSRITDVTASAGPGSGVSLSDTNNMAISRLNASARGKGIYLYNSHKNNISDSMAFVSGIDFTILCNPDPDYEDIVDLMCTYGIGLDQSSNNTFTNTNSSTTTAPGILLRYADNNKFSNVKSEVAYDCGETGSSPGWWGGPLCDIGSGVIMGRSSGNNFTSLISTSDEGWGVGMMKGQYNSFTQSNISSTITSFYMFNSISNNISSSNISSFSTGLKLHNSHSNMVAGSRIYSYTRSAIELGFSGMPGWGSSRNTVSNSLAFSEGHGGSFVIVLYPYSDNNTLLGTAAISNFNSTYGYGGQNIGGGMDIASDGNSIVGSNASSGSSDAIRISGRNNSLIRVNATSTYPNRGIAINITAPNNTISDSYAFANVGGINIKSGNYTRISNTSVTGGVYLHESSYCNMSNVSSNASAGSFYALADFDGLQNRYDRLNLHSDSGTSAALSSSWLVMNNSAISSSSSYSALTLSYSNNRLLNLRINSTGSGAGLELYGGDYTLGENNSIVNCSIASGGAGLQASTLIRNLTLRNSSISSSSGTGAIFSGLRNSTINGSRLSGNGGMMLALSFDNVFANNTVLSSSSQPLLLLQSASANNTFYWNNFTNASGVYIGCTGAGYNRFNTTMGGHGEGNIWSNVLNGSVNITSSPQVNSLYGTGWRVGNNGTGYPYSNISSQGKIASPCGPSNITDWAPLRR